MTCIVAIEKGNGFVIGTDSIAVDANNEVDIVDGPKWHIAEDYVAAWCGSFEMIGLIQSTPIRKKKKTESPRQYANFIASTWRAVWRKTAGEKDIEGSALLVVGGRIFYVQHNFSVYRSAHGYASIGSASTCALGSLFSSILSTPYERAITALNAATMHTNSAAKPFHILECTDNKTVITTVGG